MKVAVIIAEKKKHGIELYSVSENATLKEAAAELNKNNIGALLVTGNGGIDGFSGILSERDIIRNCCKDKPLSDIKVADVAVTDLIVVTADDSLETARAIMAKHHIRHLPVIDDNTIIGMITIRDVIKVIDEQKDIKIKHLSDFVGGTYNSDVF